MSSPSAAPELPLHAEVVREAESLQLGVDASELHGALCGYLCGGGRAGRRDWLTRLAIESDDGVVPATDAALDRLFRASQDQLGHPGMGFALLLPEDEAPVEERAESLLAWCRGFLGGFGLATGAEAPLSAEAAEALDDLSRIAASQLSYDEPEADETALTEIVEFVRVAAMLLYGDCHMEPREPGTLH